MIHIGTFRGRGNLGPRVFHHKPTRSDGGGGGAATGHWKQEWGQRPPAAEITRARDLQQRDLSGHDLFMAFRDTNLLTLRAMFYVEPQMVIELVGASSGNHVEMARELFSLKTELHLAIMDSFIPDKPAADIKQDIPCLSVIRGMFSIVMKRTLDKQGESDECLVELFKATTKKAQLLNGLIAFMQQEESSLSRQVENHVADIVFNCEDEVRGIYEQLGQYARDYLVDQVDEDLFAALDREQAAVEGRWEEEWGPIPDQTEITAAQKFLKDYYHARPVAERGHHAAQMYWQMLRDEKGVKASPKALFYVDPQITTEIIGLCEGGHKILAEQIFAYPKPLWGEMLSRLIVTELPEEKHPDQVAAKYMYSLVAIDLRGPLRGVFFDLFKSSDKKLAFINQSAYLLCVGTENVAFEYIQRALGAALKHLEAQEVEGREEQIYARLSAAARRTLIERAFKLESVALIDVLRRTDPEKKYLAWQKEWGELPSDRDLYEARRFAKQRKSMGANFYSGSFPALFFLDPKLTAEVVGLEAGNHFGVAGRLSQTPEAFILEVFDRLILEHSPQDVDQESSITQYMSSLRSYLGELIRGEDAADFAKRAVLFVKLFHKTDKKAQLINQVVFLLGTSTEIEDVSFARNILLPLSDDLKIRGEVFPIWSKLTDYARAFLLREDLLADLRPLLGEGAKAEAREWPEEWGSKPTDEEMVVAREFKERVAAQEGETLNLKLRYLKAAIPDFKVLFYLDPQFCAAALAFSRINHFETTKEFATYPKPLRLAILDHMIWEESPKTEEDPGFYAVSDYSYTMLAIGFYAVLIEEDRDFMWELSNTIVDLFEGTAKKGQLINQLVLFLKDFFQNQHNESLVEDTAERLDELVQSLRENPDLSIYPQLTQPVIDFLSEKYGADFIALLQEPASVTQAQETVEWPEEWGEKPSDEEIARAKEFKAQGLLGDYASIAPGAYVSNAYYDQGIDLKALFFVDPQLTAVVIANTGRGRHSYLSQQMREQTNPFLLALVDTLVLDESPDSTEQASPASKSMYALAKIIVNFTGMIDVAVEYFEQTTKRTQFIEQLICAVLAGAAFDTAEIDGIVKHIFRRAFNAIKGSELEIEKDYALIYLQGNFGTRFPGMFVKKQAQETVEWPEEWGSKPSDEEIARAQAFQAQNLKRHVAAAAFHEQGIDLKALFYVAPDVLVEVIAFGDGYHFQMSDILRLQTDGFILALIDRMVLDESPDTTKEWSPAHPNMFSLIDIAVKVRLRDELILDYLRNSPKRTQFIEQMIFTALRMTGPNAILVDGFIYKFLGLYFHELEQAGEQVEIEKEYAWQYLEAKLGQDSAAWVKKQTQAVEWLEEWGEKPTDEEIARAKEFKARGLRKNQAYRDYIRMNLKAEQGRGVPLLLKALFYVEPILAVEVMGYAHGEHLLASEKLKNEANQSFMAALLDAFILEESPRDLEQDNDLFASLTSYEQYIELDRAAGIPATISLRLYLFSNTSKRAQFINQLVHFILTADSLQFAAVKSLMSYIERDLEKTNGDHSVWQGLTDYAKEYLLESRPELAVLLGSEAAVPIEEAAEWKDEWGPRPSDEAIAAAREFIELGLRERQAVGEFLRRQIDIRALFYLDPQYTAEVAGSFEGEHLEIAAILNKESWKFRLALLDYFVLESFSEVGEADLVGHLMYTLFVFGERLGSAIPDSPCVNEIAMLTYEIFCRTKRKAQFVHQLFLVYHSNSLLKPGTDHHVSVMFEELVWHYERSGGDHAIWSQLPNSSKDYLLESRPELAVLLGSEAAVPIEEATEWKDEWGPRPSDEAIARAREFAEQGLKKWAAADAFDGDIALLFAVAPELAADVIGYLRGHHMQLFSIIHGFPKPLVLAILDQLVAEQSPETLDQEHRVRYLSRGLAYGFAWITDRRGLGQQEEKIWNELLLKTDKKAQLINQICFICQSDEVGAVLMGAGIALRGLVRYLKKHEELAQGLYSELAEYAKEHLENKFGADFIALLQKPASAAQAQETVEWPEDWGDKPTNDELAMAQKFIDRGLRGVEASKAFLSEIIAKREISLKALLWLDPDLTTDVIGFVEGRHNVFEGLLKTFPIELAVYLINQLLLPGFDGEKDKAKLLYFTIAVNKYLAALMNIIYFKQAGLKAAFVNQYVYFIMTMKDPDAVGLAEVLLKLCFGMFRDGVIEAEDDVYKNLTVEARDYLKPRDLEVLRAASSAQQIGEGQAIDVTEYFSQAASCDREEDRDLSYSAEAVELFLDTFEEDKRSAAMAALLQEDEATARMLMRSAKGHHVEIAAALSEVPQETLLPVLQREILAFPTLDPGNKQGLSDFYTHNGFGAMKYLIYNGDPSQIRMSPLFAKLSNETIAKLLQIFHVFCTMESMLGRMLAGPLGKSIDGLGLVRIAEISSGVTAETIAWLKRAKIIDIAQILAEAAELEEALGPNETLFSGKVYSTTAWEEFIESGQNLAELESRQMGIVLRGAKFHGLTRSLLEPFEDQEIADILDTELSHFAGFDDAAQTRRFMELDGCSLMKIVALLPVERAVNIFNLVAVETQAAIFEQAHHFSQTSEYFLEEFIERLRSFDLNRDKVVDALALSTQVAADWVRDRIFNEDLGEIEFERRMREMLDLTEIEELADLATASRLAE